MNTAPTDDEAGVVHERLVELSDRVTANDSRIRRREAGGVHGMRVSLRRLRSALATFEPLYDEERVMSLGTDLAWVGSELSGARDAEVVRRRLRSVARTDEERRLADVISDKLRAAEADAVQHAVATLDSERYSGVIRDLTAFVTDPPWSSGPRTDASLRHRVRRDWKRLRKRERAAAHADGEPERSVALHDVRKGAKQLRYAAETLVPSYGKDAARLARRAKSVQRDLGEVQDAVVSQGTLRRLVDENGWTTSEAFLLGVFHEREWVEGTRAEEAYAESWARLDRKKNRRWLR